MPRRSYPQLLKHEFTGYTPDKFRQDLLAGLTVAAVALPLALAFGVAVAAHPLGRVLDDLAQLPVVLDNLPMW